MTDGAQPGEIRELYEQLKMDASAGGYILNPDDEITLTLVEGLLTNAERYGYQSCPCRLAAGVRTQDLDIICPCDYRDPDLNEFGTCYCALYVSDEVARGEKEAEPIPERRGTIPDTETRGHGDAGKKLSYPVWRCPVCGYLCAREHPPEKCPICKADKDRFKKFL